MDHTTITKGKRIRPFTDSQKIFTMGKRGRYCFDRNDLFYWHSGEVTLANGDKYHALLCICQGDSGEHYGTLLYDGKRLIDQEDGFTEQMSLKKEEVFPYKYDYYDKGDFPEDFHVERGEE
jgi:hypothetical protein